MITIEDLKEKLIDQNYWEGHEPSEIKFLTYPEVFLFIGKTEAIYEEIVDPALEDIRNKRDGEEIESCPLILNVIKLDATRGLDDFQNQINNNLPNPKQLNVYIIEPFDEMAFYGQKNEFENTLARLMFPSGASDYFSDGKVSRGWNNTHIIVITEHNPCNKHCPTFSNFNNKGSLRVHYSIDKINIGITIEDKYVNNDFTIKMSREWVEDIAYMYAKELEDSEMDVNEFGPTFFDRLKFKASNQGGLYETITKIIEEAVYQALEDCLNCDFDTELKDQLQQLGVAIPAHDNKLGLAYNLKIHLDLSHWPRLL